MLSIIPIELSNIKVNSIVSTTAEIMLGKKNITRNTFDSGIFLYMKNADKNASGKSTKSLSTKNSNEFRIALPITLPGDVNPRKKSLKFLSPTHTYFPVLRLND